MDSVLEKWGKYLTSCGLLDGELHAHILLNILIFEVYSRLDEDQKKLALADGLTFTRERALDA